MMIFAVGYLLGCAATSGMYFYFINRELSK
jgi:hypothetical protein